MRILKSLVLYTALAVSANAAAADMSGLEALREGDMKKLNFVATPETVPDAAFLKDDGTEGRLSDYSGQYVVLNFWATWCAPCRHEMPSLSALQTRYGGAGLAVVTLATGRNAPSAIDRFLDEISVTNLPRHRDPKQALARQMGVMGLPITVLIDPEGREIARLTGDADWASPEAITLFDALLKGS
ncbi:TlpA family protein disulfide reductase [Mesobacterium pallidum]|uniref:TlpA family protein disulfide reductase n=1 Tax=Mesobacterium pallidum TaxID=2872037 RepID=UPI001EE16FED|nr:TlpA disulfide reductase family protein [Mesobacterium pallidum]